MSQVATGRSRRTRTALVTGANRGLGWQVALRLRDLGLQVWLSGRDETATRSAAEALDVGWVHVDVADPASISRSLAALTSAGADIDVLVCNAAVLIEDGPLDIAEADLGTSFATNLFGPWLLMRGLVPGMVDRGYGRVVSVTSGAGSFGEGGPTLGTYGVSKAALNALTRSVAADVPRGVDVKVNAVCPGWVRTRMGGAGAPTSVEDGAEGIVWAATLPPDGPTGGIFRNGRPIPW